MKSKPFKPIVFSILAVLGLCVVSTSAHAEYGWSRDNQRGARRDTSGFGNRGSGGYGQPATTAQISQALYGTPNEPYDTPADHQIPETSQVE